MKLKYFITIVDVKTGLCDQLVRYPYNIKETIEKEFGKNPFSAQVTNGDIHEDFHMQSGTSLDNSKAFSIICLPVDKL